MNLPLCIGLCYPKEVAALSPSVDSMSDMWDAMASLWHVQQQQNASLQSVERLVEQHLRPVFFEQMLQRDTKKDWVFGV